ncbi:hypothetical protein [Amycolatopsis aidingensis]|uniref:hypothetical protein n=1 Tax=Amycolatopsis aidingensis TaxID=2842453 RepID=UPI001C0C4509|nr:hypothetical protein [Amycolatopsis aidingensis]
MSELLAAVFRGLVVLAGHLASMLDLHELWERRRRRARQAALARGERAELYAVLRDPDRTGGREQEGHVAVGGGEGVTWRGKGQRQLVAFRPEGLTLQAADRKAVTLCSADGRIELRLHPDEAPWLLRALED